VFRAIGWVGIVIAAISAVTNFAFVAGVKYTSVANALVILASTPFHAAIMSWLFLGERIALRTWIAIIAGMAGIAIIVSDGFGGGSTFGDMMALAAAMLLAAQLTMMRGRRQINMIPAVALGGAMHCGVAMMIGGVPDMPTGMQAVWILLMGFAVTTPATALLALGPRYISAPEVGLLVLLETVLGPIWVWLVIYEAPSVAAMIGGMVVIVTLLVHALISLQLERRRARQTPV
jgi:drug/metabolite transporter (DMT)-like permease